MHHKNANQCQSFSPPSVVILIVWLAMASTLSAQTRDVREEIAQQSERYRAQHFPDGQMPPKHGWTGQRSLWPEKKLPKETPGGTGYGYYFYANALLWTNSTIADYYVVAPTFAGGTVSYLYLTSTCRAQLGTESLIAYEGNNEAQFWIYDWDDVSTNAANPWPVMIDLPTSNPQYLTMRPDEFAITRQMVHIRNGTYYLGVTNSLYGWENQVMLFNFSRSNWDIVYSHAYTTTNLASNLYPDGQSATGFWGPIVETFPPYTNVTTVGFDLIRLFQDNNPNPFWLNTSEAFGYSNYTNTPSWQLLTEAQDTSFTVALSSNSLPIGTYNMGTLCVTASTNAASFSLSPPGGMVSSNWVLTPGSNSWDKTVVGLTPGAYAITFNPVAGLSTPTQQMFTIYSNSITTVKAVYAVIPPAFQTVKKTGNTLMLTWSGVSNYSYQLQSTTNLDQAGWTNLGSAITATNSLVNTSNTLGPDQIHFYRVVVLP